MIPIRLFFEIHQPFRLRPYSFFDIGKNSEYFDDTTNHRLMRRIVENCYLPATNLIRKLQSDFSPDFRFSISLTGCAIEQMRRWAPECLDLFRSAFECEESEILAETYYHSLASLFDIDEFRRQTLDHAELIYSEFKRIPQSFRNTELLYNNQIASYVRSMGYKFILLEGSSNALGNDHPNQVFRNATLPDLFCLPRNYSLSDDIAFRFSDTHWAEYPLNAQKYIEWLSKMEHTKSIQIGMDFETFGEHHWVGSGILRFLEEFVEEIIKSDSFKFATMSDLDQAGTFNSLDSKETTSWADSEKDSSAWLGNSMQRTAAVALYELLEDVKKKGDPELLAIHRKLQSSDHFYYMSTKYRSDGMVHSYFNPHGTPHQAYVYFMNVIQDLKQRIV